MPSYSLGIDIGGTFTDVVVYDHDTGRQWNRKVLTTHDDPVRAVAAGVGAVLTDGALEPRHFTRVVHATTLFTNALIERKGAVAGLITTAGFGDTLEIAGRPETRWCCTRSPPGRSESDRVQGQASRKRCTPSPSSTRTARLSDRLGQQIGHGHGDIGPRERCDSGAPAEGLDDEEAPAEFRGPIRPRLAGDLEHLVHEIHDPVVGDAGARVEAALVAAVEAQARLGDLDEDSRARGVLGKIVSREAGHHHDIRLRLGFVVERDGVLHSDEPPWAEGHA